jgi:hypothetical protein
VGQVLFEKKYLNIFRIAIIALSAVALTAELLPEVEAKGIVIPTLILTIVICCIEMLKGSKTN